METLHRLAARLDEAASPLAGARPDELDPGPAATWGDGNGGALAEVTEAVGAAVTAALHARGRELAGAAAELTRLAESVRLAGGGYRDVDFDVGRTIRAAGGAPEAGGYSGGGAAPPGASFGPPDGER